MKTRIIFVDGAYFPQWKSFLFWNYHIINDYARKGDGGFGRDAAISFATQQEAEIFLDNHYHNQYPDARYPKTVVFEKNYE